MRVLEGHLGVAFPADYKRIAIRFNGGRPDEREYEYFDPTLNVEATMLFGDLLAITPEAGGEHLLEMMQRPPEFFPEGLVPFAVDPGDNLLCFDYRKSSSSPSVGIWLIGFEHGHDWVELAASFSAFLEKLHLPG
jgi:hypothetical protein